MNLLHCHCKKVKIQVKNKNILDDFTRCDCSLCIRRGSIMAVIPIEDLKILSGENYFKIYKFGNSLPSRDARYVISAKISIRHTDTKNL